MSDAVRIHRETDEAKLRSYPVAHREVIPDSIHVTDQNANNRAEQFHQATRVRERERS